MNRRRASEERWLISKCKQIDDQSGGGDLAAHLRTIWRMIKRPGGESGAINTIHRGDRKEAPALSVEDPEFLAEAGRIGEAFVDSMDKGSIPNAFAAWLMVFCTRWDELQGDNGAWRLSQEFSFELFTRVLHSMQGKAVGAGGLSVELLLASSHEVRWIFYNAILSDVERGRVAPAWRRVIYVLLRKPPPNDPALVSQRREIALMPQDLKVLLQGVRMLTYEKISSRLEAAQFGWKKGVGCADPSVALACVLDQARRLQHSVWVLYIDLANFFPAINRAIACDCELFMGLPAEVAKLMAQIYGGQMGEPARVSCQYETGIGLGEPFTNRMGRLMGCPVSPDSAKMLLDSVLRAVQASVRGVKLWPFDGETICQLAYADDWVGLFDDVGNLRKALQVWLSWAEVVGARLGIKGLVKTVVAGVEYREGKACTPKDPRLTDLDGTAIPLLPCDGLYKHLGVPRAANADAYRTWTGHGGMAGIRDKLRAGIRRLRQLRPGHTSPEQFVCVSNVLLGGLGSFYLQAAVATEGELEQIEREWRRCFNRFAKRDHSAHALSLYMPAATWKKGRVHLARWGLAALYATVGKLLADGTPSPAQAAVRSAIALAMYHWGCRRDPNTWRWGHLEEALRREVQQRGPRYVGDAWLLACALLEQGRCPSQSRVFRAEQVRVNRWGRWRGWGGGGTASGGPLSPQATWFRGVSQSLFEPREEGGLGLSIRHLLRRAGITELNQLCATAFAGAEGKGRWMLDRKQVAGRVRAKVTEALWKQWMEVIQIQDGGCSLSGRRKRLQRRGGATHPAVPRERGTMRPRLRRSHGGSGDNGCSATAGLQWRCMWRGYERIFAPTQDRKWRLLRAESRMGR